MDYLIPTALECPDFELGETVTPCPHHPLGAKGVGESPNVGSPPAIVNAVIDALHETPRRRPHRHALHSRARVGGDAGAARAAAMISPATSRRAQELTAEGAAFVTATVVRAQRPTSVEAGNVALVLADGTIEGFVGGVCAEHSVRAYSLAAIADRRGRAPADPAVRPRRAIRATRARTTRRGRGGHRPEPVPVGRRDRGLPRAGAAGAAGPRRRRDADRGRRPAARLRARIRAWSGSTASTLIPPR